MDIKPAPLHHSANKIITHQEAFLIYRDMGEKRALPALRLKIISLKGDAPGSGTFKNWSRDHKWTFKCREHDLEQAAHVDAAIADPETLEARVDEVVGLAAKYRTAAHRMVDKLNKEIPGLKIRTGGEAKAAAEMCTALSKAAEVLDGGVSDRTEARSVMTIEERKSAAQQLVDDAFKKFQSGGQDNGTKHRSANAGSGGRTDGPKPLDNAANARTGTDDL